MTAARRIQGGQSPPPCVVRETAARDLRMVVALARRMRTESAYAFLPFDASKVSAGFEAVVTRPDHFGAVAERAGRVVGFIAGKLAHYPFCAEVIASDIGFYVAPEARASTAAVRLVRALWAWAESRAARELSLASSSGVDVERLEHFYRRLGLTKMGSVEHLVPGRGARVPRERGAYSSYYTGFGSLPRLLRFRALGAQSAEMERRFDLVCARS